MRSRMMTIFTGFLVVACSVAATSAHATIKNTPHDLSNSVQTEVCIFCHIPHNSNPTVTPLWNKQVLDTSVFTFYTSGTRTVKPSGTVPGPMSLACLTCHITKNPDGSVNAHTFINDNGLGLGDFTSCGHCHPGGTGVPTPQFMVGPDLMNDHPISIPYPVSNAKFNAPPNVDRGWYTGISDKVRLFGGRVECPSCHDPHDNTNGFFLSRNNSKSALCLTCHDK